MLLADAMVSAILPSTDLARSKDFYTKKLGLKQMPVSFDDPLMFMAGNDTVLVVYHRAEGTKAEHTVAGFMVPNLEATMDELNSNNLEFEDYDMDGFDHKNRVMSYGDVHTAWFKDPDGNIIAINQM